MRTTILAALLLCLAGCSHQPEGCRCPPREAPAVKIDVHGKGVDVSVKKGCGCPTPCDCSKGK